SRRDDAGAARRRRRGAVRPARRRGAPRRRDVHVVGAAARRAAHRPRRARGRDRRRAPVGPREPAHDGRNPRMTPVLLLDVVGLTARALSHMPRLRRLAGAGWQSELATVLPAVTCSVQSTMLTGLMPAQHGVVGNGWYFRELGDVYLWRQHNRLVGGEKLWDAARGKEPDYVADNVCWWYAMGMSTDVTVTPRPIYHADGRKSADAYVRPAALHDELVGRF